jgi:ADP-ribose pyrophosphatase
MHLIAQQSPEFDPSRPWVDEQEEVRGETRLFRQVQVLRRSPHTHRRHAFTRLLCPAWINVLAFTLQGELLMVEQFRHGIDRSTLEVVGGVVDEGEAPADAARRELLEETGHVAGTWVPLGSVAPNPAIQNNRCHFFLALDCRAEAGLSLDPSEELRVWSVPWEEAEARLRDGGLDHALVQVAFLRLFLWEGWPALRSRLISTKA